MGLLVTFCAQVSFAALPPLSPTLSEASDDEDATPSHELLARDSSIDEENEEASSTERRRQKDIKQKEKTNVTNTICTSISCFWRTVLASRQTFPLWNFLVLTSYATIFVVISTKDEVPVSQGEMYLWVLLTILYSCLLVGLFYVGAILLKALRPGLKRRRDSNALALRLLGTCVVLACIFTERVVSFGIAAQHSFVVNDSDNHSERKLYSYRKDAIQYGLVELVPVLCLLFMMHRRRRGEMPSDVLIIHSFMSNLFGSVGVLASEDEHADVTLSASDAGNATPESGTLGGRRFQSYGGAKHDSYPPGSRSGSSGGINRATSSSGPPLHPRM